MIDSKFRISSESDRFSSQSKGYPPPYPGKGKLILNPANKAHKPPINRTGLNFKTRMSFGSQQVETNEHNFSSNMTSGLVRQFHTSKFSEPEVQAK
jgi:hypothetical protein